MTLADPPTPMKFEEGWYWVKGPRTRNDWMPVYVTNYDGKEQKFSIIVGLSHWGYLNDWLNSGHSFSKLDAPEEK